MFDRVFLRRIVAIAFLSSSLAFVAAAPPATPPPTPAPFVPSSPQPSPEAPGAGQTPIVIVYPFDVQTGADPRIGTAIAQILGQEMAAAGGITVRPIPQGVKRADFLENARATNADFYISGYVTPVGDSAAVVEQVVSVESGVILFSQTAQVSTVADVASQSLLARSQILVFVGRGTEQVATQSSNTPAPSSTNGANVPISGIGNIVDSVFKHKGAAHTPTPGPVVKPTRGVIVASATASGAVAAGDLANATHELYFALNRRFNTTMTAATSSPATSADAICGTDRDNTIASGTLQEVTAGHRGQVTFTLVVYTCFGAPLDSRVGKGGSIKAAVDAAVAAYATAHPDNS